MKIFSELFSWPNGIVVGNLIASGIVGAIGFTHLDRLARKHHHEQKKMGIVKYQGTEDVRD